MKHVVIAFGGLVSSLFFACGSTPVPGPGIDPPTIQSQCNVSEQNSYGVCYPTSDIGTSAHTGTVSGSRIANFAFTGYVPVNVTPISNPNPPSATQTIHLGDYYDPQQKGVPGIIGGVPIKLIHLSVAALWCGPCNDETDHVSGSNYTGTNPAPADSWASQLAQDGIVFIQAINEGAVEGVGSTIADLNNWISPNRHNSDFTSMVDPEGQNLGIFFDAAAIPFNANIDARSMEILESDVGFDTTLADGLTNSNSPGTLDTWLKWIAANPPLAQ
jgi:hypothetical protein